MDVRVAVTLAPVVAINPVAGLQVYVVAPLAVKAMLCPLHVVGDAGENVMLGRGFTVTLTVDVLVQPLLPVTVTVYVPLAAVVAAVMVGLRIAEVKPFGPVHA